MKRVIIVFAILAVITVIFGTSSSLQSGFNYTADAVNNYITAHQVAGVAVFVSFAAVSAILSPFTSVPTIPFAVFTWGKMLTILFLLTGWFIGGIISYVIGRYGLYIIFRRILPIGKIEDYRKKLSEHSEFILVVLFRLALPAEVTGLVLGSLRYDFVKYLAATFLTEIPFAVVAVYAGGAFALNDPWSLALWIAVGSAMFAGAAALFAKKLRFGGEK